MTRTSSRVVAAGLLVVLVASGLFVGMPGRAETTPEPDQWTIAVYGCADNNLEGAWDKYTDPMLLGIPTNDLVNVVAVVDRLSTMGTETIVYANGVPTVVAANDEKDFGSPETVVWFLQHVVASYPSDKLAVIMWDHGGGWWGVCEDDTQGGWITINELTEAIVTAGVYIDVLGFDACMMSGVEVAYSMHTTGLVDMMVASERLVPYNGFAYDLMFTPLSMNPYETPEQVADDMVAGWDLYYGKKGGLDLSALDVAVISDVVLDEFMTWIGAMHDNLAANLDEYLMAFKKSEQVSDWYICDANLFILTLLKDKDVTDQALIDSSMAFLGALDLGVNLQSYGGKGPLAGITFWFGIEGEYLNYGPVYETLPFAIDTGWYAFMTEVNALMA